MKEQSSLFQKRQTFRKQIRKSQIQQIFKKIRVAFYEQNKSQAASEELFKKLQSTIQVIQNRDYYFPFQQIGINVNNDSLGKASQELCYLLSLNEQLIREPDQEIKYMIGKAQIGNLVLQKWQILYKWEDECGDNIQKIIVQISESLCVRSYTQVIINFLVQAIQFLIIGNKIMLLRRIIKKQTYLVGQPQKYYRAILRKRCHHVLVNFTSTQRQELLLPFLRRISKTIKDSCYFVQVYLNIFLTNNIPMRQKLEMFDDFIGLIQNNKLMINDYDSILLKIIYVVYMNAPNITNHQQDENNCLPLNLRCLTIIDGYLQLMKYKIQQFYASNPYSQQYITIIQISSILQRFFQQKQQFISKLTQKKNIFNFFINRLKCKDTVPQIKCLTTNLKSLTIFSQHAELYQEMINYNPVFIIQFIKCFSKLADSILTQNTDHNHNSYQNPVLTSEMEKLKLQCLRYFTQIFKYLSLSKNNSQIIIVNQCNILQKLMRVCYTSHQLPHQKYLRLSRDDCLNIFTSLIYFHLKNGEQGNEADLDREEYLFQSILYQKNQQPCFLQIIGNYFHSVLSENSVFNPALIQNIILGLSILLKRILYEFETDYAIKQGLSQEQSSNKWRNLYMQFRHKYQIPRILDNLETQKINLHQYNNRMKESLNQIFSFIDNLDSLINQKQLHSTFPIQLEN